MVDKTPSCRGVSAPSWLLDNAPSSLMLRPEMAVVLNAANWLLASADICVAASAPTALLVRPETWVVLSCAI